MSDFYQNTVNKYKGSPSSVVLFIGALVMFVIGVNHFVEDTYSSYFGLLNLEETYKLNVQIFDWSYWTMSLAPQVASVVFFYLYLADRGKKWLLLSLLSQLMDFFADAWYRGNGLLLENLGVFAISSSLTFIYFSVGSEMFISVGGGLILKMLAPALSAWKTEMKNIGMAARGQYGGGGGDKSKSNGHGGGNHQENNNKHKGSERRAELESSRHASMPMMERRGGGGERSPEHAYRNLNENGGE
jgi:hypothetical protein